MFCKYLGDVNKDYTYSHTYIHTIEADKQFLKAQKMLVTF